MNDALEKLEDMFIEKVSAISDDRYDPLIQDWDEVQVFLETNPEIFPEKVRNIVRLDYRGSGSCRTAAKRILSIYSAIGNVPTGAAANAISVENDELVPTFTLNQNDQERVLELCGQMRKIVLAATQFDEPHKKRLLNRIAGIEKQALSKKGLLDVVRAGVSDVGETLGKFGTDIKPLTDRMGEVASIARKGSKQYEQLPEPEEIKRLPAPEADEEE